ncbi:MAG: response regulator [Nitrospinota bacterium]|nr:response regulator [Nitrospinota bacterium]
MLLATLKKMIVFIRAWYLLLIHVMRGILVGRRHISYLLFILFLPTSASSAPILKINDINDHYMVGTYADIMKDPSGTITASEALVVPHSAHFSSLESDVPNLGFTNSTIWIRVEVVNDTAAPQPMILQQISSWIDQLDLTVVRSNGDMQTRHSGEMYPFFHREVANPRFIFKVDLEPGERVLLLLRVKSEDPIQLPMTLWKEKTFDIHNLGFAMYFGVIYGCLLAVLFYNFFLFFALRDKNYLYYVIYISSLLFMIFTYSGSSFQYFWPDSPRFQSLILFATGHTSMFLAIVFAKRFLGTFKTLPSTHKFLTFFQGFILLSVASGFAMQSQFFISFSCTALAMVFPLMQAIIGVMAYRNNVRAARFFVLAWSFSMFGILFTMGSVMGLYPSSIISQRSMEMGLVIDAILLSLALADKIKILRLEKEDAEWESRRALFESKMQLEAKVEERTVELKNAKDAAEAATALKEKFLALVSHDLRAPVGAIQGFQNALLENPHFESGKRDDFIRRSANAAERMLRMIDQLLNITRLKSGRLTPILTLFPARDAVEEAAASLGRQATEKKIEIINETPNDMQLLADRDLAVEVFSNLISNAIKFTHSGGRMKVAMDDAQKSSLVFSDNGKGVEEGLLENLFRHEVKTSTPGTAGEKGAGLGLPYCHEIMNAHGGNISYQPAEGGGSRFHVTFPIAQHVALLVDDQDIQRDMIKETIMQAVNIPIIEAGDGEAALAILKFARPAVIITDVEMPVMTGMELLNQIKSDPVTKDIPVIVATSGYGVMEKDQELERNALGLGALCILAKPVDPEQLISRLMPLLPKQ